MRLNIPLFDTPPDPFMTMSASGHETALIMEIAKSETGGLAARDLTPSALGLLPKLRNVFAQPTGDGAGFLAC